VILFDISFYALYLILPHLLLIYSYLLNLIVIKQKFFDMHCTLKEYLSDFIGRLLPHGVQILSKDTQVVLEHNFPIDELNLVHEHDLRGLLDEAQNRELV